MQGFVRSCAMLLCLTAGVHAQTRTTVYVDASRTSSGNGASWNSAHRDLQDALISASATTDIWVADGVYKPDRGTNARTAAYIVAPGVRLYGGFAGGETSLTARNPSANQTVLSGDLGAPGDMSDNSYHVLKFSAGSATTRLDGFVVADGNANGAAYPDESGGGLHADGALPVLESCVFTKNAAKFGAGIFVKNGAVDVRSCEFQGNAALQDGGGAVTRSGGLFKNCIFDGNTSAFGGGLMACCGAMRVDGCTFRANFSNKGGGLYTAIGALVIQNSGFYGNAAVDGGGVYTSATGSQLVNCRVSNNSATQGGGVFTSSGASLTNCVIGRNFASTGGGGVYSMTTGSIVVNCTVYANAALQFGGGYYSLSGNPTLRNSIFWANTDSTGQSQGGQIYRPSGTPTVAYCCVQNWNGSLGGVSNIGFNPAFADPDGNDDIPGNADDNFRLFAGSVCIDSADNSALPADVTDVDADGNTSEVLPVDIEFGQRFVEVVGSPNVGAGSGPPADMGAYEFVPVAGACIGDANSDWRIDGSDLSVFLSDFGSDVQPGDATDFNADGEIDGNDLSTLLGSFGNVCPQPATR